jgi:hypothetical protein
MNEVSLMHRNGEGMGKLYVGSWIASVDEDLLLNHSIRHLVPVTGASWVITRDESDSSAGSSTNRTIYTIPLDDSASTTASAILRDCLPRVCRHIDKALHDGENVLVFCQQGISRSAAIVIAFLMYSSSLVDHEKDVRQDVLGYDEALVELRKARPCAKPNDGFEATLRNFADELRQGIQDK